MKKREMRIGRARRAIVEHNIESQLFAGTIDFAQAIELATNAGHYLLADELEVEQKKKSIRLVEKFRKPMTLRTLADLAGAFAPA